MLYYTIHQSSIWNDLPNGKRNVRILVISLFIYIILHAIVYELRNDFLIAKLIHGYFFYILFVDFFASAILYKTYYGRTVLQELNPYENDKYDEIEHKYHQYNPMEGIVAQQHEESIKEQCGEPVEELVEEPVEEQYEEPAEEPVAEPVGEQYGKPVEPYSEVDEESIAEQAFKQITSVLEDQNIFKKTGESQSNGFQMRIFEKNK